MPTLARLGLDAKDKTMKSPPSTVQARYASPLGTVILAASDTQLMGLWFECQRHQPDNSAWVDAPDHPVLKVAAAQLADYFSGRRTVFELPLNLGAGTEFQQAVWRAMLTIPSGSTLSYAALSSLIGKPAAVRAVGAAVGRNPLCIIVPCHRVIGANGSLTGYAGGLERKIALLQLEGPP